jgi:hypothetical protein
LNSEELAAAMRKERNESSPVIEVIFSILGVNQVKLMINRYEQTRDGEEDN